MTGVIVLDKPEDFTSFDAVAVVRKLTGERKIGHTGTLDPMATGVLPLLLGRATRAASLLPDTDKAYEARFQLGIKTDTQDSTGEVLETDQVAVSRERLAEALCHFTGEINQVPPMYSAVSVGGKRLYDLARQGLEVERPARKVMISSLHLLQYDPESRQGILALSCSKGTYVRTLIQDIAQSLGCVGGIMTQLRRSFACGFSLADALTLEELRQLAEEGKISSVLRPVEKLFEGMPQVRVTPAQAKRFCNGGELDLLRLHLPAEERDGTWLRVWGGGEFLGLGAVDREKGALKVLKLFHQG